MWSPFHCIIEISWKHGVLTFFKYPSRLIFQWYCHYSAITITWGNTSAPQRYSGYEVLTYSFVYYLDGTVMADLAVTAGWIWHRGSRTLIIVYPLEESWESPLKWVVAAFSGGGGGGWTVGGGGTSRCSSCTGCSDKSSLDEARLWWDTVAYGCSLGLRFFTCNIEYSNHLNTEHLNTEFI